MPNMKAHYFPLRRSLNDLTDFFLFLGVSGPFVISYGVRSVPGHFRY